MIIASSSWSFSDGSLPLHDVPVGPPSGGKLTGESHLARSSKRRCGDSPAVGYYAEPVVDFEYVPEAGNKRHFCFSHDAEFTYGKKGWLDFKEYRAAFTTGTVRVTPNGYEDYCYAFITSFDELAEPILMRDRTYWVDKRYPYYYYSFSGGRSWYNNTYGNKPFRWKDSMLAWGLDEWISLAQELRFSGSSASPLSGAAYKHDSAVYDWSSFLNDYPFEVFCNPEPPLLDERIVSSGVAYNATDQFNLAASAALDNAVSNMPIDQVNWIENTLDLFSLLTGTIADVAIERASKKASKKISSQMADMLSSGWLSYRYVYTTTRMDLKECADVSRRMTHLLMRQKPTFKTNGYATYGPFHIHISLEFSTADLLTLNNPLYKLDRVWKYDAWDLVPFSFIVDWFTGIGDYLGAKAREGVLLQAHPESAWMSVSYTVGKTKRYFRTRLSPGDFPKVPEYSSYEAGEASTGTIVKRSLDALALVVGRM